MIPSIVVRGVTYAVSPLPRARYLVCNLRTCTRCDAIGPVTLYRGAGGDAYAACCDLHYGPIAGVQQ